jgi:hypothetical protein
MPRQGVTLAFLPAGKSSEPSIEPAGGGERAQAQLFRVFYKHSAIGALSTFGLTVPAMRDTIGHSLQEVRGKVPAPYGTKSTNLRDNTAETGNPLAVSAL